MEIECISLLFTCTHMLKKGVNISVETLFVSTLYQQDA